MSEVQPQIRCYLPLGAERARQLHRDGSLTGDLDAFVVTESVRGSDPGGDQEGWEYAALQDAARHCQRESLAVIVAAVDIGRDSIDATAPTGSRVTVRGPVPRARVAALHVGDDVLGDAAVPGGLGTGEADPGIELSWYDATELAQVVALT